MIKGKTIIFGHGTVAVGSEVCCAFISFHEMKNPEICGTILKHENIEVVGNGILIDLNPYTYDEYIKKLETIDKNFGGVFEFGGYTFDFTKYNINSTKSCKAHARKAIAKYYMSLAC